MIALLGDSLSVGSFPFLKARVPEAMNFSTVGAFLLSAPGRASLESRIEEIASLSPRRVLVMGGTNDLAGYPTETAVTRLHTLVRRLEAKGLEVVVSTIPPQKTANASKVEAYNYQLLAGILSPTPVVDVGGAAKATQLAGDGVHFTPAGYKAIGDAWADVVTKMVMPTPGGPPVSNDAPPVAIANRAPAEEGMSTGTKVAAFAGLGLLAYWMLKRR